MLCDVVLDVLDGRMRWMGSMGVHRQSVPVVIDVLGVLGVHAGCVSWGCWLRMY